MPKAPFSYNLVRFFGHKYTYLVGHRALWKERTRHFPFDNSGSCMPVVSQFYKSIISILSTRVVKEQTFELLSRPTLC